MVRDSICAMRTSCSGSFSGFTAIRNFPEQGSGSRSYSASSLATADGFGLKAYRIRGPASTFRCPVRPMWTLSKLVVAWSHNQARSPRRRRCCALVLLGLLLAWLTPVEADPDEYQVKA